MTNKMLETMCIDMGIKGYKGKRKEDLIKLVTKHKQYITNTESVSAKAVRKEGLDKFYTNINVVKQCLKTIETLYGWSIWSVIVEPSAGNGSFYNNIPLLNKVGIDISPEHPNIIKQDFFTYSPPTDANKILVIGNPPFGRVSSLAVKFFNHASQWVFVIAFIVPRTFRRISVQNRLNYNFHLVLDNDIPTKPCAFTPHMSVKCCFQVWERKDVLRPAIKLCTTHKDWDFLGFGTCDADGQPTPPCGADFAMRAYGGKCGEIVVSGLDMLRPKSWHWIRANICKELLIQRFGQLDYKTSNDTARQNSLGRGDLVMIYTTRYS